MKKLFEEAKYDCHKFDYKKFTEDLSNFEF